MKLTREQTLALLAFLSERMKRYDVDVHLSLATTDREIVVLIIDDKTRQTIEAATIDRYGAVKQF